MKIQVKRSFNVLLELLRPAKAPKWRLVLWGDWAEDRYRSGCIAYDIARTGLVSAGVESISSWRLSKEQVLDEESTEV
jgi:hypothetical protein